MTRPCDAAETAPQNGTSYSSQVEIVGIRRAEHDCSRENVSCFSATLSATRLETLCFCARFASHTTKAFFFFYLFYSKRFALCCTLCCTDVALRCTETPQFHLHRCPLQGLVPPDHCARNPLQRKAPSGRPTSGRRLYKAPFLGMETRHGSGAAGWVPGTLRSNLPQNSVTLGPLLLVQECGCEVLEEDAVQPRCGCEMLDAELTCLEELKG